MTQIQAMLCALAAFFGWVIVDVSVKLAAQSSLPPLIILGIVGFVTTICIVANAACKKDFASLRPIHWRVQIFIGLCSFGNWYANVIAFKHVPLTIFYPLVFTAPLIIAALSSILKHETLTLKKVACIIAGLLGVIISIAQHENSIGDWIGYAACFASVLAFAVYTVMIRKISSTDTASSIQLSCALTFGIAGLWGYFEAVDTGQSAMLLNAKALGIMVMASGFNLISGVLYNKALKYTVSTNVAQIQYTQIILGALLGYIIWDEIPTWRLVVGAVIIITSGMVVVAQARKSELTGIPATFREPS